MYHSDSEWAENNKASMFDPHDQLPRMNFVAFVLSPSLTDIWNLIKIHLKSSRGKTFKLDLKLNSR